MDAQGCFFSSRLRYNDIESHAAEAIEDKEGNWIKNAQLAIQTTEMAKENAAPFGYIASSIKTDKHDDKAEAGALEPNDAFAENPDTYCLEDEKLRTEEDHQQHAADIKKESVRQVGLSLSLSPFLSLYIPLPVAHA